MSEEQAAREAFLKAVNPHLAALLERPLRRTGNVSKVELLGDQSWGNLHRYLLLVEADGVGDPGIEFGLFLPPGATVTEIGWGYMSLEEWPNGGEH
ncbi:hypothetical protein [Streptomyces sp. enrichment culture]|uniref:hypothetical protein n=1 Tax=Streptomyces sp. enrichment culture TaxID=1795815 RepID=UPI003F56B640